MNKTVRLAVSLLALAACSGAWSHGDVSCNEPKSEWRPSVELQRKLKSEGWTVRRIQIENGCYEVYGFDETDARIEAWFNPKTFERTG